jgi:hypothetical protein
MFSPGEDKAGGDDETAGLDNAEATKTLAPTQAQDELELKAPRPN